MIFEHTHTFEGKQEDHKIRIGLREKHSLPEELHPTRVPELAAALLGQHWNHVGHHYITYLHLDAKDNC